MSEAFSDSEMSRGFTSCLRKYLRKNRESIKQAWVNIIRQRVYATTPLVYIRTEALLEGFDVDAFIKSMSIRCDGTGFNFDMMYWFDTAKEGKNQQSMARPVMVKHLAARGQTPIDKIFIPVTGPNGESVDVSLPLFMKTNQWRKKAGWTPVAMSQAVLTGKLKGSFRPPANPNTSYFAAYFTAGPNAKGNPEVYKRGGANPKDVQTKRDPDKHTILFDFLTQLGLVPDQRNKPSSNSDWIITVRAFTPEVGPYKGRSQTAVGGLITACYYAYRTIKKGKTYKGKSYTYKQGNELPPITKTVHRVADRVRATKAYERYNAAFYGATLAADRAVSKQLLSGKLQASRPELDLTPEQIEAVERAARVADETSKKLALDSSFTGAARAAVIVQNLPEEAKRQVAHIEALRAQAEIVAADTGALDIAEINGTTDLSNPEEAGQGAYTRKDVDLANKALKREGAQIIRDPEAAEDLIKQLKDNPELAAMMSVEVNSVDEDTGKPLSWVVIMESSSEGDWY